MRAQFAIRATVRSTPDVVNPLLVQIDALAEAWKAAGGAWTGLGVDIKADDDDTPDSEPEVESEPEPDPEPIDPAPV